MRREGKGVVVRPSSSSPALDQSTNTNDASSRTSSFSSYSSPSSWFSSFLPRPPRRKPSKRSLLGFLAIAIMTLSLLAFYLGHTHTHIAGRVGGEAEGGGAAADINVASRADASATMRSWGNAPANPSDEQQQQQQQGGGEGHTTALLPPSPSQLTEEEKDLLPHRRDPAAMQRIQEHRLARAKAVWEARQGSEPVATEKKEEKGTLGGPAVGGGGDGGDEKREKGAGSTEEEEEDEEEEEEEEWQAEEQTEAEEAQDEQLLEPPALQQQATGDAAALSDSSTNTTSRYPKFLYCLPGGGFNDIMVQLWRCIEYCQQNNRTLVLGYENYLPILPPYTPYFTLQGIPGVTTMTQQEAATVIRNALAEGHHWRILYPHIVSLRELLGPDPDKEGENEPQGSNSSNSNNSNNNNNNNAPPPPSPPFFINLSRMYNTYFDMFLPYDPFDILIHHKKGNRGESLPTLTHLLFSPQVKHTFLKRWSLLSKPYIGIHIRNSDRKCGHNKTAAIQQALQKLGGNTHTHTQKLANAQIYLASDNPSLPEVYRQELIDIQQREVISFTYYPPLNPEAEAARLAAAKREWEEEMAGKSAEEREGKAFILNAPPLHLNANMTREEKHQVNVDGFVDLLLLAFSGKFMRSCGGYSELAHQLYRYKQVALSTLGLLKLPPSLVAGGGGEVGGGEEWEGWEEEWGGKVKMKKVERLLMKAVREMEEEEAREREGEGGKGGGMSTS